MSIDLVCPCCRSPLQAVDDALRCVPNGHEFPVIAGIPDLRVSPDPWIDADADRDKGIAVVRSTAPGLEAAVRKYWELTPGTTPADAARHVDHVLHAVDRTREWVAELQRPPVSGEVWLDLGCGTADLACAVDPGVEVISLDIAFRWLMIARRRLDEAGRLSTLVCGNAEALPFPDGTFDRVVALGTIEHCADLDAVLGESRRVLRAGGQLLLRTANRYTILREPHVGIWGVGWLPRAWADRFVRWRGGAGYAHHAPRSALELSRGMHRAGFRNARVAAAKMLTAERRRLSGVLRPLVPLYRRLRMTPVLKVIVRTVAPLLDVEGVAP